LRKDGLENVPEHAHEHAHAHALANALANVLAQALALATAAAVSLGLARFSYALLLPPMRSDLGWSYFTAGAMNTLNAGGYLVAALATPALLRRFDARRVLLAGGAVTALLLALHAAVRADAALYALRAATGAASALSFVGGGLLAARLAGRAPAASGLVLGIYYGGVGLGIIASAALVPWVVGGDASPATPAASTGVGLRGWPAAWLALSLAAAACTAFTALGTRALAAAPAAAATTRAPFERRRFAFGLAGYAMFGLGYIGYMTFIVTLLREQGMSGPLVTAFYMLLGAGVIASSWLWAGLLQRHRGGGPLALLNALLALATLMPVLSTRPLVVFASGALFGSVFLSVVASTTALVRHNTPPAAWPAGIVAFTIIFAAGQIVGPTVVGWIADGPGGLARGFVVSAGLLALGSALAALQKPLRL
jgi:predicted MFS family arabinose efflux permease